MSLNPFHPNCGPFNKLSKPRNAIDAFCHAHDIRYQESLDSGVNPYLRFNDADRKFMDDLDELPANTLGKRASRALYQFPFQVKDSLTQLNDYLFPVKKVKFNRMEGWGKLPRIEKGTPITKRRFKGPVKRRSKSSFRKMYFRRKRVPYYKRRPSFRRRPYRRYNRFYKRRYYRSKSFSNRVKSVIMRQLAPPRTWMLEDTTMCSTTPGTCQFLIPMTIGSTTDMEAATKDLGDGSVQLGLSSHKDVYNYFRNCQGQITLKNMGDHDAHITAYCCVLKERFDHSSYTSVRETALNYLLESLKDRMLDADESSIGLALSSERLTSDLIGLNPYMCTLFTKLFKIVKVRKGVIPPAGISNFKLINAKMRKFNNEEIEDANTDGIRGYTKFWLFKVHGSLGVDGTDETKCNVMSAYIAFMWTKKITTCHLDPYKSLLAVTDSKDSISNPTGPSDFDEKDDIFDVDE